MNIRRIPASSAGRSKTVTYGGLVYTVATANSDSTNISEQTGATLDYLDKHLQEGKSDKTRILQATVYLKDMATKEEMDQVWCKWIGPKENWPQRACVGADLAGNDLIEIVVTAAQLD